MKLKFLGLLMVIMIAGNLKAQDYKHAIGLRGGFTNGITYKRFISEQALEFIFAYRYGGFGLTGLYEFHKNAFDEPGLNWVYGFGAHVGSYDRRYNHKDKYYYYNSDYSSYLGIDGVFGIEYVIPELPITLTLDFMPSINIFEDPAYWWGSGLSIRYVIE